MSAVDKSPSVSRRQSRAILKRQTIVEDVSKIPKASKASRQNTLTVFSQSSSSNEDKPPSRCSTPAKSPTRLFPIDSSINLSKSADRLGVNTQKAAARWRAASSFDRSDSHSSTTSVRVSGRRPRASAFRLGASTSVAGSPRPESFSASRDSGNRSPSVSPGQRKRRDKAFSINSSSSVEQDKSPRMLLQTSSDVSTDSPIALHRAVGPVAPLVAPSSTGDKNSTQSKETTPQRKFNNYQIMAVKKGLPDVIGRDPQGRKYSIIQREIPITPYCVCQRNNKDSQKKPLAWIFSIFTTIICIIFPVTSFSADVAFYITCSDHYNHTAQLLANVTAGMEVVYHTAPPTDYLHMDEAGHVRAASPIKTYLSTIQSTPTQYPPAPLLANGAIPDYNLIAPSENAIPLFDGRTARSNITLNSIFVNSETITKDTVSTVSSVSVYNVTVCAKPSEVIDYMRTSEAAENLEHHRHVTLDIFEPVFILGSFPSLLLSILTRVVVMLTGHDHFLSAYFINIVCMPLQLATGALGVYSASYHLGEKGFSCWSCAVEKGDCSSLTAFSWLTDEVTIALIVSLITKLLDGFAGGIVVFVVIMRVLWRRVSHVNVWWYVLRLFASIVICAACLLVGSLLILTPALAVIRIEFFRPVSKFPGYDIASSTVLVLLIIGVSSWCLTCGLLVIYLTYNCYIYCRIKEH